MALPSGSEDAGGVAVTESSARALAKAFQEEDVGDRVRFLRSHAEVIAEKCNPEKNPTAFRRCQDAAQHAVQPLLMLAQYAPTHDVRNLAFEALTRVCFGNSETAAVAAASDELGSTILAALKPAEEAIRQEEHLAALQFVQALAAVVPEAPMLAQLLSKVADFTVDGTAVYPTFRAVRVVAVEVLLSCSLSQSCRKRVARALSESLASALVASGISLADCEVGKPAFSIGLLFANLCNLPVSHGTAAASVEASEDAPKLFKDLAGPLWEKIGFFQDFGPCLTAALRREPWPVEHGGYHKPWKLVGAYAELSAAGFVRDLLGATSPLIATVARRVPGAGAEEGVDMCSADDAQGARLATRVLFGLAVESEALLAMREAGTHFTSALQAMVMEEPTAHQLLELLSA